MMRKCSNREAVTMAPNTYFVQLETDIELYYSSVVLKVTRSALWW